MSNPNYPQLNETLVVTYVDEQGRSQEHSWTIYSEHPKTGAERRETYEGARQHLYRQLNREVPDEPTTQSEDE